MMTADEQLEFYRTRFGRLVTSAQRQRFWSDLSRSNLDVMSAALRQAEAAAKRANRPPTDVRLAVLAQYERIAGSMSQLFPVFFIFESAWRSYVAVALKAIYGSDDWWHGVRDAVAGGSDTSPITVLGGRQASTELVRTVTHVLTGVRGCGGLETTYELVEESSLGHLGKLIEGHWGSIAAGLNGATPAGPPTWSRFEPLWRRVRQARNDAYHHRVVSDRTKVVAAAEQLLDLLDVHLGSRWSGVTGVTLNPPAFALPMQARHQ
jgi:hypothetical protein